jgi:hypothetical protein
MGDHDPVVALWCARQLAAPSGPLPAQAGRRLLGSARASVRAFALGQLAGDQLSREELRRLLTDPSGAVRSVARCRSPRRCRAWMTWVTVAFRQRPYRSWPTRARGSGTPPSARWAVTARPVTSRSGSPRRCGTIRARWWPPLGPDLR